MLETLDHAVIAVRDLAAAAETYELLLGRRPSWCGQHPDLGTANVLFSLEHTYLELLAPAHAGPVADLVREHIERDGEGLLALAFGTDDAGATAVTLRERGIAAADPVDGMGREATTGVERRWRNAYLSAADTRGVLLFAIEHAAPRHTLPTGEPLGGAPALVSGVDHVVVMTQDADASRALYGDKLGLRLALDRRFEERGIRLLFFRIGGVTVELAASLQTARQDAVPAAHGRDRLWGLSYRVPDVAASRARLAQAGFDVSEVRRGQKPGTRVCTVRRETHGVATLLIGAE